MGIAWASFDNVGRYRPGWRDRSVVTAAGFEVPVVLLAAGSGALVLTAVTAVVGANSSIVDHPAIFVTLRTVCCAGLVLIALVMLTRGSERRMPELLIATSSAMALTGLTGANSPGPFAIGRLAVPVALVLVIYVCFAFPDGRIHDRSAHRLVVVSATTLVGLTAANLLLYGVPPVAGPFVRCVGRGCPTNPLNLVDVGASAGRGLSIALGVATAAALVGAAVITARRAAMATPLQRHSLTPLLTWTVLAALSYAFFVNVRVVDGHAGVLTPVAVVVAAIIAVLPAAIALGLTRGRVFAMAGLERLIAELGEHRTLVGVQKTMSKVFDDPGLQLLFWRRATQRYVDCEGHTVDVQTLGPGRKVSEFNHDGERIAAAIHDPILAEDVLQAAGSAIRLTLANERLETDLWRSIRALESSRKRVAGAADAERRRIEQDLHDGAQQALIALRIKLHLLEELTTEDPEALAGGLADAGRRVDSALDQIRNLAQGIYPAALRDLGLSYALVPVARELPIEVALDVGVRRRLTPELEATVYFCCVEALQNVAKHCGPQARARVRIWEDQEGLGLEVIDHGRGFDPELMAGSRGITGMQDRLESTGGRLTIRSAPGRGTTISGRIPLSD